MDPAAMCQVDQSQTLKPKLDYFLFQLNTLSANGRAFVNLFDEHIEIKSYSLGNRQKIEFLQMPLFDSLRFLLLLNDIRLFRELISCESSNLLFV